MATGLRALAIGAVVGAGICGLLDPAAEAALAISPTQIDLSTNERSQLIDLTNDSDAEVRIQVEVFAWDQRPDGGTVLAPTQDILAFPPLLAVPPHETKRIRVGSATTAGASEKSYRMTVQELPAAVPRENAGVQILTKISLPVFVRSTAVKAEPKIEAARVGDGTLSFAVRNAGTEHFLLRGVTVSGHDAAGGRTFEAKADGWYVLAGGVRDYRLALSAADCRRSGQLQIAAQLQEQTIESRVDVAGNACGSGTKTQFVSGSNPQP